MSIIVIGDYMYSIDVKWAPIIYNSKKTDYEVSTIGEVRNAKTGKILSQFTDRDGYKHAAISLDGKQYHPGTHRYVATAFIPNPDNKPEVNHINGNKADNTILNLEWVTTSENIKHAFDIGLKSARTGSSNSLSHYTDDQINTVCKLLEKGVSNKKISKTTGVDRKYITDIKKGRRWKHISCKYDIKSKKYSDQLKNDIRGLLSQGFTPSQIITKLNISNNQAHISLIERIKRDMKVSAPTTIPEEEVRPQC